MRISTDATMLLTDRVDQLDVHPDAVRVRKHAAFQHIEHAKFRADLPDSDLTVPVGKRRWSAKSQNCCPAARATDR